MNFFKAQDQARRKTGLLILLFVLAVICLVLLTNLLLIGTFAYMDASETDSLATILKNNFKLDTFVFVSIGVSLLILLGSIYKVSSLSKGGQAIAELLGGQLVPQSTKDLEERQLLNVVEEMSIAAGMPIPKVYILKESAINAFAAGQSHSNAVIGVTRGTISQLTREELQGVIAHEFSHIFNGDMKLNLRLMGILYGILLIGIIGEHIFNSLRFRSSSKKDNGGAIIVVGIGLMVIGYAGTFFGKMIKASVSRQREYLADASAVQFTRNKESIAGALKKIGGSFNGSMLETPSASEYSHAYFANGVKVFFTSLFSTHPPLETRIRQVDPTWDGKFITPEPKSLEEEKSETKKEKINPIAGMAVTAAVLTSAEQIISKIGTLSDNNIEVAHQLIQKIPETLKEAAQNPYSARAIVYAILIREQTNKDESWKLLKQHADQGVPDLTNILFDECKSLDEQLILPLLELSVNALRELSEKQYLQFKNTIHEIITSDRTVDLNEWVIQRLVLQQLDQHFALRKPPKAKHAYLGAVKKEAEVLFSLIATIEHKDNPEAAKNAFELGKNEIGAKAFNFIPKNELSLNLLNDSLDQLMKLKPVLKPRILKACAKIILADGKTTRKGIELFRTISASLDCPVPLLNFEN